MYIISDHVSTQYFAEVKSELTLLNVRNRKLLTNPSQAINAALFNRK